MRPTAATVALFLLNKNMKTEANVFVSIFFVIICVLTPKTPPALKSAEGISHDRSL